MQSKTLDPKKDWSVFATTKKSQAATMVVEPGKTVGGPDNEHKNSDQWMIILSGSGTARINGEDISLEERKLILIEAGDKHEIRNTGKIPLKTVNIYAPPEY